MSLLHQRRQYLASYRCTKSHEAAAKSLGLPADIHEQWMKDKDGWLYRSAFAAIEKELKEEAEGKKPPPPPPKRPPGRPRKALPPAPKEPKRIGRPPKKPPEPAPAAETPAEAPPEPQAAPPEIPATPPPPPLVGTTFPGEKGHVTIYAPQGEVPVPPPEPEKPKRQAHEPAPEPPLDLAIATDAVQRALIDEYGELDRRMQIRAADTARYETLKRAIKTWFAAVPADADGCVEGDVYLLHLSACERERKIRDMQALIEAIGLEKVLEICTIPLGVLENLIGKDRVSFLTTQTWSGSRRIKAIPKRPAAVVAAG